MKEKVEENMLDMVLYIGIITVGYIVGTKLGSYEQKLKWRGKVQTLAIMALVVLMGARMGCNEQVINNIRTIGVTALVMTLVILFFSIGAIFIARKAMGFGRNASLGNKRTCRLRMKWKKSSVRRRKNQVPSIK